MNCYDAIIQYAGNTKTTLSAQGWPAAVAFIGGAAILGGVTCYGIYKYCEYKKLMISLDDTFHRYVDA